MFGTKTSVLAAVPRGVADTQVTYPGNQEHVCGVRALPCEGPNAMAAPATSDDRDAKVERPNARFVNPAEVIIHQDLSLEQEERILEEVEQGERADLRTAKMATRALNLPTS